MATPFEEIYDLALTRIQDYKLDELFNSNIADFYLRMESYIINAIPRFDNSKTSLDYTLNVDPTLSTFNNDLSITEKDIVSRLLMIEWFERTVNNLTQFQLHLQDSNFKTFAEANNLNSKKDYLAMMREDVDRVQNTYGWRNINILEVMGR